MIIPIFVIGLASSVLTEILKLYPILSKTDNRKRVIAFAVSLILSVLYIISQPEYQGLDGIILIGAAAGMSFAIYKSVIQIVRPPKKEVEEVEPVN